jgi:hypothetical protein
MIRPAIAALVLAVLIGAPAAAQTSWRLDWTQSQADDDKAWREATLSLERPMSGFQLQAGLVGAERFGRRDGGVSLGVLRLLADGPVLRAAASGGGTRFLPQSALELEALFPSRPKTGPLAGLVAGVTARQAIYAQTTATSLAATSEIYPRNASWWMSGALTQTWAEDGALPLGWRARADVPIGPRVRLFASGGQGYEQDAGRLLATRSASAGLNTRLPKGLEGEFALIGEERERAGSRLGLSFTLRQRP